jgi:hypothetical protein
VPKDDGLARLIVDEACFLALSQMRKEYAESEEVKGKKKKGKVIYPKSFFDLKKIATGRR